MNDDLCGALSEFIPLGFGDFKIYKKWGMNEV